MTRQASATDRPGLPELAPNWRHVGWAALCGLLATLALLRSPLLAGIPPIVPPYVPIDLRFLALPLSFATTQALSRVLGWPARGVATLGAAVLAGAGAHLHASAALDFVGVAWANPGTRVDLPALAATLGSLLLALWITFETARDRFTQRLRDRGVPDAEVENAGALANDLIRSSLLTAALAVSVLGLALSIVDRFTGAGRLPLPEVAALAFVLALGAILLGVAGREDLPLDTR